MTHPLLSHLHPLSEITASKDIRPLSAVTYPGTHCPLFGATLTLREISDAVMLVIGTEECTYYTKSLTLVYEEFGGLNGRCLSYVMDRQDVTFGCRDKLEQAAAELVAEFSPKAVFLVTTCVPEMTGEDVDSLAVQLTQTYGLPFLAVHTQHFRCDGHLPGVANVLRACVELMEPCPQARAVNLLGKNGEGSEVVSLLQEAGVETNLTLPGALTVGDFARGPRAQLNVVCAKTALPLAREMEERFSIPYVSFFDRCMPQEIEAGYEALFAALSLPVPVRVRRLRAELEETLARVGPGLQGASFVYGHAPVEPFVLTAFLSRIGMVPLLVQAKEFEEEDRSFQRQILDQGHDPYVSSSANLVAMARLYPVLKPQLYLGPAERDLLLSHGIIGLGLPQGNRALGFELSAHILECFAAAMEQSRRQQEGIA